MISALISLKYSLVPFGVSIAFLGLGISILLSHAKKTVKLPFFFLCITTFIWQFSWAILFQQHNPEIGLINIRFGYFFIVFLPTTMYHFLINLSDSKTDRKYLYLAYLLDSIFAITVIFSDLFVSGLTHHSWGFYPKAGILHPLHVIQTSVMVTRGLYIVFKKSRQTSGNEKSQLTYCIAGLFVYFFAAIDYLVNYGINFYPPGILFVMVSIAILAFAITKHELMDINVIITRSVSHIITGASVVITFLFIPIIPTPYSWIIDGLIGLFWARFGQSIHLFIQTTAEKKFLKGSYDYREVLTKFTHRFSRCATVSEVMTALDFHLVHDIEIRASAVLIPEGFDEKKELSGPYIPADTRTTVRLTDSDTLLKILHSTPETIYANQSSDTTKTLATLGCTAVVPCMHNDQLMAILLLGEKMSNDGFTRDDKGLFPLLGAQIGIVLNRLRQTRFEAELNIAQRIQSEILPRNPSISNLELACLMIPATEMGGDYYDIIHTPTGTWILLGDVTGHGVGSAMVMFMVQSIVTTLVKSNSVTTPSELLYNANRILCQNMQRLDEGRPLTIVALHTIDGRHFSYCGAHDAIMILRNDQPEVEMVEIDQFPFGIGMIQEMTLEEFGSGTLSLDPGDILFIGTDGITEAAKNGRYTSGTFGEAGLADCLITHRTKPLTEFSDALINQLKHYTNNTFHDDITFIAARSV